MQNLLPFICDFIIVLSGLGGCLLVLVGCLSSSISDILVGCLVMAPLALKLFGASPSEHLTKNIQPNNSTDGQGGTAGGANQRRWDEFGGTAPKKTAAKKKDPPSGTGASAGPRANRANQNRKQKQQQQQLQQQPPAPPSNLDNVHCHYMVLGIPQTASSAIKKAYRNMALKYHPDKNSEEDAADIFRRVQWAYEILGNDQTRISYNAQRRRGGRK